MTFTYVVGGSLRLDIDIVQTKQTIDNTSIKFRLTNDRTCQVLEETPYFPMSNLMEIPYIINHLIRTKSWEIQKAVKEKKNDSVM